MAALAEVPVGLREIYETEEKDFLLFVAAITEKVVRVKEDAQKKR